MSERGDGGDDPYAHFSREELIRALTAAAPNHNSSSYPQQPPPQAFMNQNVMPSQGVTLHQNGPSVPYDFHSSRQSFSPYDANPFRYGPGSGSVARAAPPAARHEGIPMFKSEGNQAPRSQPKIGMLSMYEFSFTNLRLF